MDNYAIAAGAALQWLRAQPWFKEWMAVAAFVVASCVGYWLTNEDAFAGGMRVYLLGVLEWAKSLALGTQGTSFIANLAVKAGANPEHPLIPVTKNK